MAVLSPESREALEKMKKFVDSVPFKGRKASACFEMTTREMLAVGEAVSSKDEYFSKYETLALFYSYGVARGYKAAMSYIREMTN